MAGENNSSTSIADFEKSWTNLNDWFAILSRESFRWSSHWQPSNGA